MAKYRDRQPRSGVVGEQQGLELVDGGCRNQIASWCWRARTLTAAAPSPTAGSGRCRRAAVHKSLGHGVVRPRFAAVLARPWYDPGMPSKPMPAWKLRLLDIIERALAPALDRRFFEHETRDDARLQQVLDAVGGLEHRTRRDLRFAMDVAALESSARLLQREAQSASLHTSPHDTLHAGLAAAPPGLVLEFGVYSGTTLGLLAASRPGEVHGFDSFEGLPERWRSGFDMGKFSVSEVPVIQGADIVVGLFRDALPNWLLEHPETVALVHIDCDLYSSTKDVLDLLGPRLRVGTVLVFDEFWNYPGWEAHEARAWIEFTVMWQVSYEYLAVTANHEQVAIRVTSISDRPTGAPGAGRSTSDA